MLRGYLLLDGLFFKSGEDRLDERVPYQIKNNLKRASLGTSNRAGNGRLGHHFFARSVLK